MQIVIQATLLGEDGDAQPPIYSYFHSEMVMPSEDAQESGLRGVGALLSRLDEAKGSIATQAQHDLPAVAKAQEQWEAEQRERQRRDGA